MTRENQVKSSENKISEMFSEINDTSLENFRLVSFRFQILLCIPVILSQLSITRTIDFANRYRPMFVTYHDGTAAHMSRYLKSKKTRHKSEAAWRTQPIRRASWMCHRVVIASRYT